jgi:cyclohexyl-isocyanide hydratase
MRVLALAFPGMTLIDLVAPLQALSAVPGTQVQVAWKSRGPVPTDAGVSVIATHAGWITSVCNGSLLLGAAGLLKGFRAGCYWYTRDQLALFGAIPDPSRVVFDRNRATGGGMTAGVDFGLALVGKLVGEDTGRLFELLFEYAPDPPFKVGRPELAPPPLLGAARDMLSTLMPRGDVEAAASKWKHA